MLDKSRFVEVAQSSSSQMPLKKPFSSEPQNGLYKPQSSYKRDGTGTPIVRIDSFKSGGAPQWALLKHLECAKGEISTYRLHAGDLLINRVNSLPHLGKVAYIDQNIPDMVFESNLMRFSIGNNANPRYAAYALSRDNVHAQIEQKAKLAVHQASINQTDVSQLLIPVPPRSPFSRSSPTSPLKPTNRNLLLTGTFVISYTTDESNVLWEPKNRCL